MDKEEILKGLYKAQSDVKFWQQRLLTANGVLNPELEKYLKSQREKKEQGQHKIRRREERKKELHELFEEDRKRFESERKGRTEKMFYMYKEGKSIRYIAKVFNCSHQNIFFIFHSKYSEEYKSIQKQRTENLSEFRQCPYCKEKFLVRKCAPKVYCSKSCFSKFTDENKRTPEEIRKWGRERMKRYYKTKNGKAAILRAYEKQKARPDFKLKTRAWTMLHNGVKNGNIIKPDNCEKCNAHKSDVTRIEGHHDDYNKPLEVVWVCPPCHRVLETT